MASPGAWRQNVSRSQPSLFDGVRMSLQDSIDLSLASLTAYGGNYRHWVIAYSGGKDSTACGYPHGVAAAPAGRNEADGRCRAEGHNAQVVLPAIEDRFYVYMFGRGVPPPKNRFRWCTPQIKVEPMQNALASHREQTGEKLLMLTGVRLGESAARDQRIALSCSKDSGECGQGWFQTATDSAVADTLAPLLHWRLCHIYDWLYFDERHGYDASSIAAIYGDGDVRTGCIGCNLVDHDTALQRLVRDPKWSHLSPLLELKPLYRELTRSKWRKRKAEPETLKNGKPSKSGQRMGPLTMAGRKFGLETVLGIQKRAGIDLVNTEEERAIRDMWARNVWPNKWSDADISANTPIDRIMVDGDRVIRQALLVR